MRFKVDKNLPMEVAELLTVEAHDAVTVNAEGLQGSLDTKLAEICLKTMRRTMPLIGQEPLTQHLWIVEETQIRIRRSEQ